MIKFKCKCCKQIFEIKAKGSWTTKKYCEKCVKQMKSLTSKHPIRDNDRPFLNKRDGKRKPFGYWIIDNIHIPKCKSCDTLIAKEKELYINKYNEYYNNKNDYENNDNKNDDIQIYSDDVEYDYGHGDIICKKCKTIVGRLELYDY